MSALPIGAPLPSAQPSGASASRAPLRSGRTYLVSPRGARLPLATSTLEVTFLDDTLVHLVQHPAGVSVPPTQTDALDRSVRWPGPTSLDVSHRSDGYVLQTPALSIEVTVETGRVVVMDRATGRVRGTLDALTTTLGTNGHTGQVEQVRAVGTLRAGERIYGLGDGPDVVNRRGQHIVCWNTDAYKYERGDAPLYKTIPFFVSVTADTACGFFFDNPFRAQFDLGAAVPDRWTYEADGGHLSLYVFAAATPEAICAQYQRLTGRIALPPRWALGYQQSRYSYATEAEVRAVAASFRERRIPCDVLYFDIHYMDGFRVFTWNTDAFPDPPRLLRDLQANGFRSIAIVDPGVKADDPAYPVAQEGLAHGYFVTYPDGRPYVGAVWPGPCYFPDFTNPAVRAWWGRLQSTLLDAGLAGIWNDMNEPAIFTAPGSEETAETLPAEVRFHLEGRGGTHAEAHNVYGMAMTRATSDGLRAYRAERRPFVLTRAAYAGTQRYGAVWTGDNTATWDHLKLALEQVVALAVSGMPFTGSDVGGYSGTPDAELLVRWTQLGSLTPLFRNHSAIDTPRQEPWLFGPEAERCCRAAIELRYQLLPYLYTAFYRAATDGRALLLPLGLRHPDDAVLAAREPHAFYLGDDLLAYPVLERGARYLLAYLPANDHGWFVFDTGEHVEAETTYWMETPLDRIPLFARAGSIVPLQSVVQHTGEAAEVLTLHVFPGPATFESLLYDDEGDGYAYQANYAAWFRFAGTDSGDTLTCQVTRTGAYTPAWTRWDVVVYGLEAPPTAVRVHGADVPFTYETGRVQFTTSVGASFVVVR